VGPRASLNVVECKEKYLALAGNKAPAILPVAHHYTDWTIMPSNNDKIITVFMFNEN
jgi:hypothetical protein